MKKVLLTTVMSLMMCMGVFAQNYLNAPKNGETVIGAVSVDQGDWEKYGGRWGTKGQWYTILLKRARAQFPNRVVDIRDMYPTKDDGSDYPWNGPVFGKIVALDNDNSVNNSNNSKKNIENAFSRAMEKSFREVREGSRVAIDMVNVSGGINISREEFKDFIIDALLDNGYRVVAKDYLEKMYEEQQAQQSGIYNERTTVQENNFSAVGYYVNVKVTETSLRVQVVNVSTGEYEGNATVNF